MQETCPRGHEIRTASDRDTQGFCRECKRERERSRRTAERAVLDVVRVFVSAGVEFETDGIPVQPALIVRQLMDKYDAGAFDSAVVAPRASVAAV